MAQIHELIQTHGIDRARELVTPETLPLLDAAATVLSTENTALGITYAGFCQTALPHRKLAEDAIWERQGHSIKLVIGPGIVEDSSGATTKIGVPYGSRARMILLYLQTQARRRSTKIVPLGGSMNEWLDRMAIPVCGKAYRDVEDQAQRLSSCQLTFFHGDVESGGRKRRNESFVKQAIQLRREIGGQRSLFTETVELTDAFYDSLCAHPVPLLEEALREISGKSLVLDVYLWLAYRLHSLSKPQPITWAALHGQFGAGYKQIRQFKPKFLPALHYALAVYPEARVEEAEEGLVLHPSPSPIPMRLIDKQ